MTPRERAMAVRRARGDLRPETRIVARGAGAVRAGVSRLRDRDDLRSVATPGFLDDSHARGADRLRRHRLLRMAAHLSARCDREHRRAPFARPEGAEMARALAARDL